MAYYEIAVVNAPWQRLDVYLNDTAATLELSHNATTDRWSLAIDVNGIRRLEGRRIVEGVDLLAGYGLGLGRLYLLDWEGKGEPPGRTALPAGRHRLIHEDDTAP